MKALAIKDQIDQQINMNIPNFMIQGQITDLEVVENNFQPETGHVRLILYSKILRTDNHKVFLKGNRLGLVINEHIEINRPVYIHHYNLQSFNQQSYDRLHSASILLPKPNYRLISQSFNSDSQQLEIILGVTSFD